MEMKRACSFSAAGRPAGETWAGGSDIVEAWLSTMLGSTPKYIATSASTMVPIPIPLPPTRTPRPLPLAPLRSSTFWLSRPFSETHPVLLESCAHSGTARREGQSLRCQAWSIEA